MTIKASRTGDVAALIAGLASDDEVKRESAIARLAVIGERAVDRLVATFPAAPRETRVAVLRALEAIGDPRAMPVARKALSEGGDVAVAAALSLRPLLQSADGRVATVALDVLVGIALDTAAARRVRMAAYEALADMPEAVTEPVSQALQREGALVAAPQTSALTRATWDDALNGRLPESPSALRDAIVSHGESAAVAALQQLIDAVRARESTVSAGRRDAWREVRGAIHQALALRGSRIALYDLRETLEKEHQPLPAAFVAALKSAGDATCLEPIATAWAAGEGVEEWRQQLTAAFAAIVKREKLTRRNPVLKRIASRYPKLLPR
jgi:HEAT repeat protein